MNKKISSTIVNKKIWSPIKLKQYEIIMYTIPIGDILIPRRATLGPMPNTGRRFLENQTIQVSSNPQFRNHDFRDCFSIVTPNQLRPTASAVLIAKNAILTVNHFRRSNMYKSNFWQVTNQIRTNSKARISCKPISPPLKVPNEDLEILILENSLNFVKPIEIASTKEINQAKEGLIVGYGNDENGVDGTKRELEVKVETCSTNNNYLLFNCNNKRHLIIKAEPDPRLATDGINPRDSGCPLYINCNGKIKLAGIASMSLDDGEAGLFIRVDTYEKEIKKILARFPPES